MEIIDKRIVAAPGRMVHRLGTDHTGTAMTLLPGETLDSFEEVDPVPAPDPEAENTDNPAVP